MFYLLDARMGCSRGFEVNARDVKHLPGRPGEDRCAGTRSWLSQGRRTTDARAPASLAAAADPPATSICTPGYRIDLDRSPHRGERNRSTGPEKLLEDACGDLRCIGNETKETVVSRPYLSCRGFVAAGFRLRATQGQRVWLLCRCRL